MNKYYKYCFGWVEIKFLRFYFIVSIIFTPFFYITPDSEKNYIEAVYKKKKKKPIYKISTNKLNHMNFLIKKK